MIGILINSVLKASLPLKALVSDKIYPYCIEEEDTLPAVVYRVLSITPEYDKSGLVQEENIVEVLSFATTYKNCLDITKEVRTALEFKKGDVEGINIKSCRVQDITETYDFETNVFHTKINFFIITQ